MKKMMLLLMMILASNAFAVNVTLENAQILEVNLAEIITATDQIKHLVEKAIVLLQADVDGDIVMTQLQKDALLSQYNALKTELQNLTDSLP